MKSINEIKLLFQTAPLEQLPLLISEYASDERSGVQKMIVSAQKRIVAMEQELQRIEQISIYERKYADYQLICGIDEVGRGPLAGPVVAGAVILPPDCKILYINDSKQ